MELIAKIFLFIFAGVWTSYIVNSLIKGYKLDKYYLVCWYAFIMFELFVLFTKLL